jgi:protein-tyrosine phosphatase
VIDLHVHILHGLDDGSRTLDESVAMAREASAFGVETIAATPHVRSDYPTSPDEMERRLQELRTRLEETGVRIQILAGAEIAIERLDSLSRDEVRRFGLAGNPSYLLVETPYRGWPLDIEPRFFHLRAAGITPVLAHPERNAEVQEDIERVAGLVRSGALVQVTASSLTADAGGRTRETGLRLIDEGLAHLVASDAHGPALARIGLDTVAASIDDAELAHWLTRDVPAAIVADRPLPPRAAGKRRRRLRLRPRA